MWRVANRRIGLRGRILVMVGNRRLPVNDNNEYFSSAIILQLATIIYKHSCSCKVNLLISEFRNYFVNSNEI